MGLGQRIVFISREKSSWLIFVVPKCICNEMRLAFLLYKEKYDAINHTIAN